MVTTPTEQRAAEEQIGVDRIAYSLGATTVVGSALLVLMPPSAGAWYPPCPLLAFTGLDCPFCGGLRGTYALLHGDLGAAFDHNILVPFLALGFVVAAVWWAVRRITSGPVVVRWSGKVQNTVLGGALGFLLVFWLVRNLPAFPYLDSGLT